MRLLNVGCGPTYHPAWVNMDAEPAAREVIRYDARRPLPFEDGCFDACYSSHLLEHLSQEEALSFLRGARRVLKPGGVLRVVVPDLERVVAGYMKELELVLHAPPGTGSAVYDWSVVELLDQMVRDKSGGRMGEFLKECPPSMRGTVTSRIGLEAEGFWAQERNRRSGLCRLIMSSPGFLVDKCRLVLLTALGWLIGGKRGVAAVRQGWFRTSGEVHRWMYDRYSLARLLEEAGFRDVALCDARASRIDGFACYQLDVTAGAVRKPDSLFMEGVR